jgi:hypothetical protein
MIDTDDLNAILTDIGTMLAIIGDYTDEVTSVPHTTMNDTSRVALMLNAMQKMAAVVMATNELVHQAQAAVNSMAQDEANQAELTGVRHD